VIALLHLLCKTTIFAPQRHTQVVELSTLPRKPTRYSYGATPKTGVDTVLWKLANGSRAIKRVKTAAIPD